MKKKKYLPTLPKISDPLPETTFFLFGLTLTISLSLCIMDSGLAFKILTDFLIF